MWMWLGQVLLVQRGSCRLLEDEHCSAPISPCTTLSLSLTISPYWAICPHLCAKKDQEEEEGICISVYKGSEETRTGGDGALACQRSLTIWLNATQTQFRHQVLKSFATTVDIESAATDCILAKVASLNKMSVLKLGTCLTKLLWICRTWHFAQMNSTLLWPREIRLWTSRSKLRRGHVLIL